MESVNVIGSQPVMPLVVKYTRDGEPGHFLAYVSYNQNEVYCPFNPEFDTEDMKAAILKTLEPLPTVVPPTVPDSIYQQIAEVRAGGYRNFGQDIVPFNRG